nr:hypothetical protein [Rhodoferax sp.]
MFLKRQDHRISIFGGLLFLMGTLATGISVFVVMQRQAESILSKSLEVSLQSNVRLFENRIDQALKDSQIILRIGFVSRTQFLRSYAEFP